MLELQTLTYKEATDTLSLVISKDGQICAVQNVENFYKEFSSNYKINFTIWDIKDNKIDVEQECKNILHNNYRYFISILADADLYSIFNTEDNTLEEFVYILLDQYLQIHNRNPYNENYYHLTVGRLKETIKDLGDDVIVCYERIEDIYFNNHHWKALECLHNEGYNDVVQQIPAFCAYKDDSVYGKILAITAHY